MKDSKEDLAELQDMWNKLSFVAVPLVLRHVRSLRIIGVLGISMVILVLLRSTFTSTSPSYPRFSSQKLDKHPLAEALRTINAPFIHPVAAPYFVSYEGKNFTMTTKQPAFTKPLGKDMCILDIDQRAWSGPNELFDENHPLIWDKFDKYSAGILNHYLYAMIHGYRYTFVRIHQKPDDRYVSWVKVPAMIEHLRTCKYMLFVEADGIFKELTLPMEWQMNYWNFTKDTKVAMPLDPVHPVNMDWNGVPMLNLGFVLAQNTPRTHEIWGGWASCLDDPVAFPDCEKWRNQWPSEQGAYSHIIRYKYNQPDDLITLPCDEANGYPEADYACYGTLNYQHHWIRKDLVKQKVIPPTMQSIYQSLQLDFLMRKDETLQEKVGYTFGTDMHRDLNQGKKCLTLGDC